VRDGDIVEPSDAEVRELITAALPAAAELSVVRNRRLDGAMVPSFQWSSTAAGTRPATATHTAVGGIVPLKARAVATFRPGSEEAGHALPVEWCWRPDSVLALGA